MRRFLLAATAVVATIATAIGATQATALPTPQQPAPPVSGIPTPCLSTNAWPEEAPIGEIKAQLAEKFNFRLEGRFWTEEYRPSIKILWETLDAMECTPYRAVLQSKVNGTVGINASRIRGWAWGDWSLTRAGYVSLDFEKFKGALAADDEGRLVRLVAHELAHTYNSDRYEAPEYWKEFQALYRKEGTFSSYAGRSVTENFADAVGYYVGRCALDNPYNSGKFNAYYEFVKTRIFAGKEFGPPPGSEMTCTVPKEGAEEPRPGHEPADGWLSDLAGE